MKTRLFFLSITFLTTFVALFGQVPVLELAVNDLKISNEKKIQHLVTDDYTILEKPSFQISAITQSGKALFGELVIDLNLDGIIEDSEILSKPIASNAKGNFYFQVELSEKAWVKINRSTQALPIQFRVGSNIRALATKSMNNISLSSIQLFLGEPTPTTIITRAKINDKFIENAKEDQHFTSNQVVIFDGPVVKLDVETNYEGNQGLYAIAVADFNGDGKIDETEILSDIFEADTKGNFSQEFVLNDNAFNQFNQLKYPVPIYIRVGENVQTLYSSASTSPLFASVAFRAIGPVITVDTTKGDQNPSLEKCLFMENEVLYITVHNYEFRKISVTNLNLAGITVPFTVIPNLPITIPSGNDKTFELEFNIPLGDVFADILDSIGNESCFYLPITMEYIYPDEHTLTDTLKMTEKVKICFCEEEELGKEEDGAKNRLGAAITPGKTREEIKEWQVFPNPVKREITLQYNLSTPSEVVISISNLNGQIVKEVEAPKYKIAGFYQQTTDVSDLTQGVYLLILLTDTDMQTKKIIKQ